jgi:uncharacterized integral membrane protein
MRTFLKLLVLVPLALIAVAFAVANRQGVTVSFDPFASDVPAFALSGPLFVVIIVVVVTGVVIGGIATWFTQGRHRRAARTARREAQELQAEVTRLKAELQAKTAQRGLPDPSFTALPGQNAA